MNRSIPTLVVSALLLSLAACSSEAPEAEVQTVEEGPTFWGDVAPIYYERCVECHREGGIAPFRLDPPFGPAER